ncbi:MAG: sensor histidine kinase [Marinilabiliaceae bacterium]|nr:sensor histidine kinase [Marinilabiliaceae bacterium]
MKPTESQRIAGIAAISFTLLIILFLLFSKLINNLFVTMLLGLPLFFIFSFTVINYIIKRFIDKRIKPIYKTIHSFKPNVADKEDVKDIFGKVNQEVVDWIQSRTNEIQKLKQLEKYRKEYLGNVSHELKTPIFNIQGYILTLLDGGLDDPNINMLYLKRTEKSIDRIISIVEDLEAISKLESGELEIQPEPFSISQLVMDIFDSNDMRAKDKNIQLKFEKSSPKDVYVFADKQRIYQVLMNLVVNSINYGKKGGQTKIQFYDMDNLVLIEVKDNGIGIGENDLPRIFERFYRVDKSRSRDQGGTGLGLSIVKHIIEAHNQTINVNSKPGEGTAFTFTLEKIT